MLFTELDDDCLECIFIELSLENQFALKKTCNFFQQALVSMWQSPSHGKRIKFTQEECQYLSTNLCYDWLAYMDAISHVVEVLEFASIHIDQFRLLKNLAFPKVKTFKCQMRNRHTVSDVETKIMVKLFPALTSLKLLSSLSGKYLWQLKHLVDLDLSCCNYLSAYSIAKIFHRLKLRSFTLCYDKNTEKNISAISTCSTLESVTINEYLLFPIIDNLMRMPAMRHITVRYKYTFNNSFLLFMITKQLSNRMDAMIFNNVLHSTVSHIGHAASMTQLRRLVVYNEDVYESQLLRLAENLQNLREIQLISVRLKSIVGLLNLIDNCPKLEILNLSHTPEATIVFLERLKSVVERQAPIRTTPLKLYCKGTEIAEHKSMISRLPSLLVVIPRELHISHPTQSYFECMWQPKCSL